MKSNTPVLETSGLAATAGKKTAKIRKKLKAAEAELNRSNFLLAQILPESAKKNLAAVLKDNIAAEEKVREAAAELEVVAELLGPPAPVAASPLVAHTESKGRSGEGAKSVIAHLRRATESKNGNQ